MEGKSGFFFLKSHNKIHKLKLGKKEKKKLYCLWIDLHFHHDCCFLDTKKKKKISLLTTKATLINHK